MRTGAAGGDATGMFSSDDLLGDIYAGPYVELEPELAFVLDAGDGAVGYVLGTASTAGFVDRFSREWLPRVAGKYPTPGSAGVQPSDERFLEALHNPDRMLVDGFEALPAQLHIDILPSHQGQGWGRRLIETFCQAVSQAGATGVHLGVAPTNTRAIAFYEKVGFHHLVLPAPTGAVFLGMTLSAA